MRKIETTKITAEGYCPVMKKNVKLEGAKICVAYRKEGKEPKGQTLFDGCGCYRCSQDVDSNCPVTHKNAAMYGDYITCDKCCYYKKCGATEEKE